MMLAVEGLIAGYDGVPVLHDINLTVNRGEVVTVLGANGAGKTTMLLAVAGDLAVQSGTVRFDNEVLSGPMHRRVRLGIGVVTEERSIFRQLTVDENLGLGRGAPELAFELAPELRKIRNRKAGLLSGGEQQILTLARVLAAKPRLLLADELSLGLAPIVADRMLSVVRDAADGGVAVLLVEQQAARALRVADRAYVLRRGRVVLEEAAVTLRGDLGRLSASYLSDH